MIINLLIQKLNVFSIYAYLIFVMGNGIKLYNKWIVNINY